MNKFYIPLFCLLSLSSFSQDEVSADWSVSVEGTTATLSINNFNNFTVGLDGHWHYILNDNEYVAVHDINDVVITNLPVGNHTIIVWLVDHMHNALDPAVEEVISFSTDYSTFDHQGDVRDYIFYEPENLPADAALVFVLHGYSSDATNIYDYSGMNSVAEEYGFAVCYPRGTLDNYGNRFWNVGYEFHPNETVDDVDFLVQLSSYLSANYNLSSENIFSTGMSNGGEMGYMLACQASDTFRGVVSVAGMMLQDIMDTCNPERLIPILEIHGTNDYINIYNGDPNGSGGWGAYPSIPETIEYWSNLNNCSSFSSENIENSNTSDGSYVIKERNYDCQDENEIWLYKVVGGDHDWPGAWGNFDINSSLEAWLFFEQTIGSLSIDNGLINELKVFPNPSNNLISISNITGNFKFEIYTLKGELIKEGNYNNIPISELENGIYIIKIISDNRIISKRIIKKP